MALGARDSLLDSSRHPFLIGIVFQGVRGVHGQPMVKKAVVVPHVYCCRHCLLRRSKRGKKAVICRACILLLTHSLLRERDCELPPTVAASCLRLLRFFVAKDCLLQVWLLGWSVRVLSYSVHTN